MLTREEAISILKILPAANTRLLEEHSIAIIKLLEQPQVIYSHRAVDENQPARRKVISSSALYVDADLILIFRTCDRGDTFVQGFTLNNLRYKYNKLPPIPQDDEK